MFTPVLPNLNHFIRKFVMIYDDDTTMVHLTAVYVRSETHDNETSVTKAVFQLAI